MQIPSKKLLLNLMVGLFFQIGAYASTEPQAEYQKLQARLERENNPAEKARLMLKLADWHLNQAVQESRHGDPQKVDKILVAFTDWIKDAQNRFRQVYATTPKKYLEVYRQSEMQLHKQLRQLENLKTIYSFDQMQVINQAVDTARKTREDLLSYLFGEENVRGDAGSRGKRN